MGAITFGLRERTFVLLSICVFFYSTTTESKPLSKRAINEVQLMHNVGVHKHVELRKDWLQMKLRDIHTASLRNTEKMDLERLALLPGGIPKSSDPRSDEDLLVVLANIMNSE